MTEQTPATQVRPATEGWSQQLDGEGRPLLQFASPRRKQPEKHLADLDLAGRKARAVELGVPAFRAPKSANAARRFSFLRLKPFDSRVNRRR